MSDFTKYKEDFSQYVDDLSFTEGVFNEQDIFKNIQTMYGVPTCIMDMVKTALIQLLPSSFLVDISSNFTNGKNAAFNAIESMTNNFIFNNGLWVYDAETGQFSLKGSNFGIETDSLGFLGEMSGFLANIQGFVAGALQSALGTAEQIEDLLNCISKYLAWEASKQEPKGLAFGFGPILAYQAEIEETKKFLDDLADAQQSVNDELERRAGDPSTEPLNLSDDQTDLESPFRLAFGPPQSTTGKFLLSVDGIYYDAQSGGIPDVQEVFVSSIPESGDEWKLEHEAALGGKGQQISSKTFNQYANTVFDANNLDTSKEIEEYYAIDPLLNKIKGQKNKEIQDIKDHIDELTTSGYSEDSALVVNTKQSLQSVSAKYEEKINKRRKQIELYVKFSGTASKEEIIPVNDFSYITNEIIAPELETQKKLIFRQGELDGVILPVEPKFVKAADSTKVASLKTLNIGDVGSGEIVTVDTVDGSSTTVVSLSDKIVTSEIIAVYNFLEANTFSAQSEYDYSKYRTINSANVNNFSLAVGESSAMFVSGLSIPYVDGVSSTYFMLPDTDEFRDLTYKKAGFSIDFWVHMPNGDQSETWEDPTFKKLLLSCSNKGSNNLITSSTLKLDQSSDVVRGLEIGFTSNRRLVSGLEYNVDPLFNDPGDYLSFYVAPTQAYGTSSIGYIHQTDDTGCITQEDQLCKLSYKDSSFATGFTNFSLTVSPENNEVIIYKNGVFATSGTMKEVFGVEDYFTAKLPSPSLNSSHDPAEGPIINPSKYSPWIVGGEITQDLYSVDTGLKSHIGSLKFYAKALNSSEVLQNYNAQSGYFTNISI